MKYQAFTKFHLAVISLFIIIICSLVWFFRSDGLSRGEIHNVLLISIDTCRADHLSCYGYYRKTTPNIDALADKAILFENVVVPVPLTLPSHSSMLTGTIPPYHGIHDNLDYQLGQSNITLAEILRENGFLTGAVIGAFVMDSQFGLDQGFNTYNDQFLKGQKEVFFPSNERRAEEVTHFANIWLEKHHDENFFLFLHYFDPHTDYIPPEPFASKFPFNPYAGEIAYTDYCIGQVIQKLKDLGLYDSTLIIITSDHGEMLGEHGEKTHGYFIYRSALRVPLIFKLPGQRKSKRINSLVGLVDIVPTVCSLLGIEPPPDVQGKDLSGYFWKKQPSNRDRHLYCECLTPTRYNANTLLGVVTDRFKYIQTTRPELYNLAEDPQESINLVDKEPQRARILQDRLKQILEEQVFKRGSESKLELDEEGRRHLESLGYVAGSSVSEDFSFDQTKEDPKDLIDFHRLNAKVPRLISQKRYAEAKSRCEKMLLERPQSFEARSHLAKIAINQGDFAAAVPHLTEAIRIKPDDYRSHNDMGAIYYRQGRFDLAVKHYAEVLRLKPDFPEVRINLAFLFIELGRVKPAVEQYYRILELKPHAIYVLNDLAWILATTEDSQIYNPANAVELARKACELTNYAQPKLLDTLSVAYAAAGSFGEAIETAEKAIHLALSANQQQLAEEIKNHLELYKQGQSYRD